MPNKAQRSRRTDCASFFCGAIPTGPHLCPICGCEMNFNVSASCCYSAVVGPYARITVKLKCAADDCGYLDSRRISTQDAEKFAEIWSLVDALDKATVSKTNTYSNHQHGRTSGRTRRRRGAPPKAS